MAKKLTRKAQSIKNLSNKIWDKGIDGTSIEAKNIAKGIRRKINTTIQTKYKSTTPMILNAEVIAKITPDLNRLVRTAGNNYDMIVKNINTLVTMQTGVSFTQKELSSLSNRGSLVIDDIKIASTRLRKEIKSMLLQNIGGEMSFNQMVESLKNLYPAYESNIYTLVNTAYQKLLKDSTYTKYQSVGFEYYKYIGPNDKVTRDYCERHVGKVFTATEANQIQTTLMTFYNCRHELVPITKEEYDIEVANGNKGTV
jgi:SPP1 gp7 family putative phage head morphogenesis protein